MHGYLSLQALAAYGGWVTPPGFGGGTAVAKGAPEVGAAVAGGLAVGDAAAAGDVPVGAGSVARGVGDGSSDGSAAGATVLVGRGVAEGGGGSAVAEGRVVGDGESVGAAVAPVVGVRDEAAAAAVGGSITAVSGDSARPVQPANVASKKIPKMVRTNCFIKLFLFLNSALLFERASGKYNIAGTFWELAV